MANARSSTDEREDAKDEVIEGASALNMDVIKMIKARYDAQDKERENIIKKSRDIQKLSKNAVFSLHRGQLDTAAKQLKDCAKVANEIQSTILAEPNLRHQGSFTNCLEEFCEALLFLYFLNNKKVMTRA